MTAPWEFHLVSWSEPRSEFLSDSALGSWWIVLLLETTSEGQHQLGLLSEKPRDAESVAMILVHHLACYSDSKSCRFENGGNRNDSPPRGAAAWSCHCLVSADDQTLFGFVQVRGSTIKGIDAFDSPRSSFGYHPSSIIRTRFFLPAIRATPSNVSLLYVGLKR